ncbi:MAG: cell division protein ZapE [Pseudohongiellaceae bacterium]|jgi:cell division protein ZapE
MENLIKNHHNSPKTRYLNDQSLVKDESQLIALELLENIYQTFKQEKPYKKAIKGAYLWGKVGRGKTCLMDIFYHSMNSDKVLRLHFHHFMKTIHQQLRKTSGHTDPLKLIAKNLSKKYNILCFDELFVSDIGDAMLLGKLFQYLFELKVTLIATSNIAAENLYKNGLQRERFLPAIKSIMLNTHDINLNGEKDHRERTLHIQTIYFLHAKQKNQNLYLLERFQLYSAFVGALPTHALINKTSLENPIYETILGRDIVCIARDQTIICFEFSALCEGPRSHLDYVELASRYQTILVFNIPPLSGHSFERIKARGTEDGSVGSGLVGEREVMLANMDDATRRFIALVDELYDQKVVLFLTSSTPLDSLYTEGSLTFEFERTRSRLIEMASTEYQQLSALRH